MEERAVQMAEDKTADKTIDKTAEKLAEGRRAREIRNTSVDSRKTGAYLAALRKRFGYTQMEAAERLHISNKAISKWESGVSHS